jgi:hypothetical protein
MYRYATNLVVAAALIGAVAAPAGAQIQSTDQQKCITGVNKAAAKLVKTVNKAVRGCWKNAEKGRLSTDVLTCILDDGKGKISKAQDKISSTADKRCGTLPSFGFTSAAETIDGVMWQQQALAEDVYGSELLGGFTDNGSKCRSTLAKDYGKTVDAILKEFSSCKKRGLKDASIASALALDGCFDAVLTDAKGKIGKTAQKLQLDSVKKCDFGDLDASFSGLCAGVGTLAFGNCMKTLAHCRSCLMLNLVDGLARDCDLFDDGLPNLSCSLYPPTTSTTTTSTTTTSTSTTSTSTTSTTSTSTTSTTIPQECAVPGDCDDGNPCTDDDCPAGFCTHVYNTAGCDDGISCTGPDVCSMGVCSGPDNCPMGEFCNTVSDMCELIPTTTTTSTTSTTSTSTTSTTSTSTTTTTLWPPTPQDYVAGPISYLNTLVIPGVDMNGDPVCCRDFGTISRDYITNGTNKIDNALAKLAAQLSSFVNFQDLIDQGIMDGSIVLILDHHLLDYQNLPDDFYLAPFNGSFDTGTTYTEANAGTGEFLLSQASFIGGTGEPLNVAYPSVMTSTDMTAPSSTLTLPLPLAVTVLNLPILDTQAVADHGTITAAGINYTNGELSGYVETAQIFGALNAILLSPTCSCLGISSDVYTQNMDGSWSSTCVSNAATLCTQPGEDICVTLAGTNVLNGEVCSVLPNFMNNAADIDLNSDPTAYEGLSMGFQFTGVTGTVNGVAP